MLEGLLEGVGLGQIGDVPRAEEDFTAKDYIPGQPLPILIKDPTGKVIINPLKPFVKPAWLIPDPVVYTMFANEVTNFFPMLIDGKGHFEVVDAFFQSSRAEGFAIEIFSAADIQGPASGIVSRPLLMNREVHVSTIASGGGVALNYGGVPAASNAGRPYKWPCTYWISADTDGAKGLFVRFRNLAAASNTVRFALHGRRWFHTQADSRIADRIQSIYRSRMRVMPFFYTTDSFATIPGGAGTGTLNRTIRFDDVSWTEVFKMSRVSTDRFLVRIAETASRKRLMGGQSATELGLRVRDDLVFGGGEFPFLLWESNLFEPNFQLDFDMTNLISGANTVWITLGCRKIMFDPKDSTLLRPSQAAGVMR